MTSLLRLDLDLIRRNLSGTIDRLITDDDVYRMLAARGVWRHSDEWWGALEEAVVKFSEGEVVERRLAGEGHGR